MDHRLHRGNAAVQGQAGEAWPDHRLAQNVSVLLGQISPGAKAAAGCHDHGCYPICHVLQSERRRWVMALSRPGRTANLDLRGSSPGTIKVGIFCSAALAHLSQLVKL
jgi:hypothetical protein